MIFLSLLTENRIEFLKKQHAGGFTLNHDLHALHTDTGAVIDHFAQHGDPTPNKQYTQWILNQYKKQNIRQEDVGRIHSVLQNFYTYRNKLSEKDINKYKTLGDIEDAVQPHVGSAATKREAKEHAVHEGLQVLHKDDKYQVNNLLTVEASKALYGGGSRSGKKLGTDWCTAANGASNMFHHYTRNGGTLHTIHIKDDPNSPYQFDDRGQFMDRHDRSVGAQAFVGDHPALRGPLSTISPLFAHTEAEAEKWVNKATTVHDLKSVLKAPGLTQHQFDRLFERAKQHGSSVASGRPYGVDDFVLRAGFNKLLRPEHVDYALDNPSDYVNNLHLKIAPTALRPRHILKALDLLGPNNMDDGTQYRLGDVIRDMYSLSHPHSSHEDDLKILNHPHLSTKQKTLLHSYFSDPRTIQHLASNLHKNNDIAEAPTTTFERYANLLKNPHVSPTSTTKLLDAYTDLHKEHATGNLGLKARVESVGNVAVEAQEGDKAQHILTHLVNNIDRYGGTGALYQTMRSPFWERHNKIPKQDLDKVIHHPASSGRDIADAVSYAIRRGVQNYTNDELSSAAMKAYAKDPKSLVSRDLLFDMYNHRTLTSDKNVNTPLEDHIHGAVIDDMRSKLASGTKLDEDDLMYDYPHFKHVLLHTANPEYHKKAIETGNSEVSATLLRNKHLLSPEHFVSAAENLHPTALHDYDNIVGLKMKYEALKPSLTPHHINRLNAVKHRALNATPKRGYKNSRVETLFE